MLDRVRTRAGQLALAMLVVLIVHNLAWAVRNQVRLRRSQRPHPTSHQLTEVAAEHPHPGVHGTLAVYYLLAERAPGGTLTIPANDAGLRWMLERVARQQVRVGDARLVLPGAREQAARDAGVHRRWERRGTVHQTYVVLDEASRDHVLASSATSSDLFVVPAAWLEEPAP